ncbi:von Willebrand factor type D domain protein [Ancylostoma duodenale]|uniref:von Willebrand factor type D domain protein n=1 Tax=Ancylostoma duodenale TaxID=51022 RepID=A0A0C2H599_9BILA|nr:von Willebrand factor type D domain protein [Ancylostoma duodenale]
MKLLAGIALLGLTLASTLTWDQTPQIHEEVFRPGREYRYLFDGQVTTGLALPNTQQSATRIQAVVNLQPVDERTFLFHFNEIRFGSIQDEFEPHHLLPFERYQIVKLDDEHMEMLKMPIRFVYRHGMVSDIEFSEEDRAWSVNIKKAVINMLQVNLLKRDETRAREHEDKVENKNFFVAVERTLEGECEVEYTTTQTETEKVHWTKSINFQKCNVRPQVQYGIRTHDIKKTDEEKLFSTVMKFEVSGNRDEYLVHEVQLVSQYKLIPLSKKHELITSFVNNKMTLVYAGKIENHIPNIRHHHKESLIYNSEWELAEEKFAMTGDEKYLHHIPELKNKIEHIEKIIATMIRHMEEKIDLETTHMFARLVKLLRFCREQELIRIERFIEGHEKAHHKIRALYYDALAMAATKVTVTYLMSRITEEKIDHLRAARLFKALVEVRVPSELIANEVLRACESSAVEKVPFLKQSCWLTYGAIFNGLCNNDFHAVHRVEKVCHRELKERFIRRMIDVFEKVDTRYEKVLMLKTLANAGIDISVFELEKIIYNKDYENSIRIEAINALRRLRYTMPRKVQSILMPIYKNRLEVDEIRMIALHRILETMPEQVVIDQIVRQMEVERDHQLRAYTFKTLKTISEFPEIHENTVRYVKKALRTVDSEFYERLYSRVFRWTVRNIDKRYGTSLTMHNLFTKDSVLPKELITSLDTIFGGEWYKHFLQLGVSQQNVDEILNKLLRRFENMDMEKFVVRGKRSTLYAPTEIFKRIYEKLNFVRRRYDKEEPHVMLYIRYKDVDYAFLPIDVDTIPKFYKDMVHDGKLDLEEIERLLATGTHFGRTAGFYIYEYISKIPTTLGLPLVLSSKMPTVGVMQGHIKIEMEPKESRTFNGLRLRLVLKPKIATTHIVRAIIMNPVVESGFKMLHSATFEYPLETETEVTWKHQLRLKTIFRPLEHKKNVLHLQSRPVTFIRHMKKTTHAYPEPTEVTLHLHEHLYPVNSFERTYFKRYGHQVIVTGTLHRPVIRRMETLLNPVLFGYNTLDIHIEPTDDVSKEYVFNMEMETFVPERIERPELEELFRHNDEFFEVVDELEPRRKEERRTHLTTYLRNLQIEKAYRHRLFLKLETVGQRVKHEAEMELRAVCDNKYRVCRTKLHMRRTPFEWENRLWEMRLDAQTVYPKIPKTLEQLREILSREFHGIIDVNWGAEHRNTVFIRMQGEQTREQKMWLNKFESKDSRLTEMEKLRIASDLNLYKILVKYELVPETEYYMHRLFKLLNTWQVWNTEYEMVNNRHNMLHIKMEIEPLKRRMFDLLVDTPESRIVMRNLMMPLKLPTLNIQDFRMPELTGMKDVIRHVVKQNRAECIVKTNEVTTFDNLFLKTPLTTCYSVLAKDCHSEEPRFVVMMKKVHKEREEKKLKIVTPRDIFVLEMINDEIVAKVNNRRVNHDELRRYKIVKVEENLYKIDIEDDVVVLFDGYQVNIKLSHIYKNMQCGVCGHYDGEKWNDLRRADNEETEEVGDFHRSYIAKDEECDIDEVEIKKERNRRLEKDLKYHDYRLREENELRGEYSEDRLHYEDEMIKKRFEREERFERYDEEIETRKPLLRTRVIERERSVCFSVEPVHECPRDTIVKKDEEEQREVEFVCLRENTNTRRLLRKAHEEVIPRHLLKGQRWITKIHVPRMCTVY